MDGTQAMTTSNATQGHSKPQFAAHETKVQQNEPEQAKYYCGRCEGWYLDEKTLIEHVNMYHEYWCTLCREQIPSETELKQHLCSVHCQQNRCSSCRIMFISPMSAMKHMLEKHSEIKDKVTPVAKQLKENQQYSLSDAAARDPEQDYLCGRCNVKFANIPDTAKHMLKVHRIKIGVRKNPKTGKEEIFMNNIKGKSVKKPSSSSSSPSKHALNPQRVLLNGGEMMIAPTKNGRNGMPSTSNGNSLPSTSSFSHPDSLSLPKLSNPPPMTHINQMNANHSVNRVTLVNNSQFNSSGPNGFRPLFVSTPAPLKLQKPSETPRPCDYCDKMLGSAFSLKRHLKNVHKMYTPYQQLQQQQQQQQQQLQQITPKIDRVLSPSEIEPFDAQNSSMIQTNPTPEVVSPTNEPPVESQALTNHNDTDSLDTVHVEVEENGDENDDDEIEIILPSSATEPPIEVDDDDSDLELTVIREPDRTVTPQQQSQPLFYVRAQPSSQFLQNLARKRRPGDVDKADIAAKLQKLNGHLALQQSIAPPRR
ncbi:uncharacterized protein LOC134827065 [Culicoides brevitarsis]|uniref:uncharacterized protein LOC134827065 n=1 Tax=Culicoides brevitarsis TaxID=469753 RepID=UPI00307B3E66